MAKHIASSKAIRTHPCATMGMRWLTNMPKGRKTGATRSSGSRLPSWIFHFCGRRTSSKRPYRRTRLSRRKPPSAGQTISSFSIPSGSAPCRLCSKHFSNRSFAPALRSSMTNLGGHRKSASQESRPVSSSLWACRRSPIAGSSCSQSQESERNILGFSGISPIKASLIGSIEGMNEKQRAAWLDEMRGLGDIGKEGG